MGINRTSSFKNPFAIPPWIVVPNGGRMFYVCSLGVQNGIQDDIASNLFPTIGAAMAGCVANRGDTIICLPGHVENVTTTPTFVAGVTIVSVGTGDERATFTWTATTSQWAINVANVKIANCIFNLAGTASTSTTKAILTTGACCQIAGCRIIAGAAGGAQVATIALEYGTGADKFVFGGDTEDEGNIVFAPADAAVVSCLKIVAAVAQGKIKWNNINVGMSATTNGVCTMTVAPTNIVIRDNIMNNSITSSTKCFVGITAATGFMEWNTCYITNASGGATAAGTLGSLQLTQNYGAAGGAVTGILIGSNSS